MRSELPPVAFLTALSLLLPLPWHWKARNVGPLSINFWMFFTNVIYGVDAVIWRNNVDIVAPAWCDITSKFLVGANFALPASCLCICIQLEQVASLRQVNSSDLDKRRRNIFDLFLCVILPVIFVALHSIVQGHRFDIIEQYGCRPTTYFSIPAILIVYVPPIFMAILCFVFASLSLLHFVRRRIVFMQYLGSASSALTPSHYFRLIVMSFVLMVWSLFVTSYNFYYTAHTVPIRKWTSWADVHANFWQVGLFPVAHKAIQIRSTGVVLSQEMQTAYYFLWWTIPISSVIFVAFFAFGEEAMKVYTNFLQELKELVSSLWRRHDRVIIKDTNVKELFMFRPAQPKDSPEAVEIALPSRNAPFSFGPSYKGPGPSSPLSEASFDLYDDPIHLRRYRTLSSSSLGEPCVAIQHFPSYFPPPPAIALPPRASRSDDRSREPSKPLPPASRI